VTIAAIYGTAGVGKTALAVHWAHSVRDQFPDGQLYANLRGHASGQPARPIEVLIQFLSALGVPAGRVPTDLETASALYRTMMTDRKTLVLLDNVTGVDQVRPLLPAGPACMVLVTGRERMAGLVAAHGARQLTLDVLSPDDALALLGWALGAELVHAEHEQAAELAELCAHLPLALRIAAANLADHPWPAPTAAAAGANTTHSWDWVTYTACRAGTRKQPTPTDRSCSWRARPTTAVASSSHWSPSATRTACARHRERMPGAGADHRPHHQGRQRRMHRAGRRWRPGPHTGEVPDHGEELRAVPGHRHRAGNRVGEMNALWGVGHAYRKQGDSRQPPRPTTRY